eukprot:Colp12_sorted_trinity150504_noHs@33701
MTPTCTMAVSDPSVKQSSDEDFDILDLPIAVEPGLLEGNPQLFQLLKILSTNYLRSDGTSKLIGYEEEQRKLQAAKTAFLERDLLLKELQLAVVDASKDQSDRPQWVSSVNRALSIADCQQLNGLFLNATAQSLQALHTDAKGAAVHVIPSIEQRLLSRCDACVAAHASTGRRQARDELVQAKAAQLASLIEEDILALQTLKRQQRFWERERHMYCLRLVQAAGSVVQCAVRVSEGAKEGQTHAHVHIQWLAAKAAAMAAKLAVCVTTFSKELAAPQSAAALRAVRSALEQRKGAVEGESRRVRQALQVYEGLGEAFKAHMQELSSLKTEIENKKWTLKQFDSFANAVADGANHT